MNGTNLPLTIAPMGHVERITHEAQVHPELQQAAAQQAAAESLRKIRSQVQTVTKGEGGKINPDAGKDKEETFHEQKPRQEAKDQDHEEPHQGNPWSGNLLDVKI